MEFFLRFERLAVLFSNTPIEGTVDRTFKPKTTAVIEESETIPLIEYLSYMVSFLLYPMVILRDPHESIADYVEQTKRLFLDGSVCGIPGDRYKFTQEIFDIIEPIIPVSENDFDEVLFETMLPGYKTHSNDSKTINAFQSKGKACNVTRRLFTDIKGKEQEERDFKNQADTLIEDYKNEKDAALRIVLAKPVTVTWTGAQFDCSVVHKNIRIIETKPKPNLNFRRAYNNIYNKYLISINSYNNRFTQLLKARMPAREEKRFFGSGIISTRLSDAKKRYWYRNAEDYGVPDIAIMLLIDGSGSMSGQRRESAMISSVILHEVLKKQNINHSIVEHRAIYHEPIVRHEILVDFMARDEEKYNILALQADEGTREGLSLHWAERYITSKTSNEAKLIIVLSDGVPAHGIDGEGDYMPPVSTKDTANTAAKIIKRGTDIIAVALDSDAYSSSSCYGALKNVYPSVVSCTDLNRLTGQLLGIISKNLR